MSLTNAHVKVTSSILIYCLCPTASVCNIGLITFTTSDRVLWALKKKPKNGCSANEHVDIRFGKVNQHRLGIRRCEDDKSTIAPPRPKRCDVR